MWIDPLTGPIAACGFRRSGRCATERASSLIVPHLDAPCAFCGRVGVHSIRAMVLITRSGGMELQRILRSNMARPRQGVRLQLECQRSTQHVDRRSAFWEDSGFPTRPRTIADRGTRLVGSTARRHVDFGETGRRTAEWALRSAGCPAEPSHDAGRMSGGRSCAGARMRACTAPAQPPWPSRAGARPFTLEVALTLGLAARCRTCPCWSLKRRTKLYERFGLRGAQNVHQGWPLPRFARSPGRVFDCSSARSRHWLRQSDQ